MTVYKNKSLKSKAVLVCALLFLAGPVNTAFAGSNVWLAPDGKTDKWSFADNWSKKEAPGEKDSVFINNLPQCELNGGKYTVNSLFIGCSGKGKGVLKITGEPELKAKGGINVGGYGVGSGNGSFIQDGGTVETVVFGVNGGTGEDGCGSYYGNKGTLTADTLFVGGAFIEKGASHNGKFCLDGVSLTAKIVYNGSGKYQGKGLGFGDISVSNGNFTVKENFFNCHFMWSEEKKHFARLKVTGGNITIGGNFYNGYGDSEKVEGVLEIAGDKGKLNIDGDFTQIEGSSLVFEFNKETNTLIQVKGNVNLNGTFKARLSKGYMPNKETWWDVVKGGKGSPVGTFSKIDFSEMPNPEKWTVSYDTDECVFRVGFLP